MVKEVRVEIVEDIKVYGRHIARAGQQGVLKIPEQIDWYGCLNRKRAGWSPCHLSVILDGNKIARRIPNWKVKVINKTDRIGRFRR